MINEPIIETKKTQRIIFLDVAKIFCVFLVVFGHFIDDVSDPARILIYTFHMPFFFFVSGLFHKYIGTIQIKKYIKTIIVPSLFFTLLTIFVDSFEFYSGSTWGSLEGVVYRGDTWLGCFSNMLFYEISHPWKYNYDGVCWFLGALFWCKLFTDCVEGKKFWIPILIIGCLTPLVYYLREPQTFCIIQGIKAFVFYYIAYKFKNQILAFCKSKHSLVYGIVLLIIMIILTMANGRVSLLGLKIFGNLPLPLNIIVFFVNAFIGSLSIICLSRSLHLQSHIIPKIGNSLITILGMQSIFFDGYLRFCGQPNPPYWLNTILSLFIIIVCYGLNSLFITYCPILIGKTKKK